MVELLVGVDLGGTQVRALVTDLEGHEQRRAATLTRAADGQESVIARIIDTIRAAVGSLSFSDVRGIAIGVPGPTDPWAGVVLQAPNLPGWRDVPLGSIIRDALGVATQLGNDANLAALGERTYGAGKGVDNLVYVTISTGIGGGIIADGHLLLGARGLSGEIGHQTILPDGPLCGCGNRGCLEALAAGPAIGRMGREAAVCGRGERLLELAHGNPEAVDARIVSQAAGEGDAVALRIIREAATYVGIGLANVCNILNPALIILGGGVTHVGPLLFDVVRETIAVRAMPPMRDVRVVPAALGDDVVLFGAIALSSASQGVSE
jgi:glucokinase